MPMWPSRPWGWCAVPQLFHLEGPSLEELKAQAAALYGPHALIVSAELVTVGGVRGVLARRHYEILVEVPQHDGAAAGERPRGRRSAATQPSGMDALLERADLDEARITGTGSAPGGAPGSKPGSTATGSRPVRHDDPPPVAVSTDTGLFATLMDNLTFATEPARAAPGPGDDTPSATFTDPSPAAANAEATGTADPPAVPYLAPVTGDPAELPDLAGHTISRHRAQAPVPAVLRAPGDLVVVVGTPAASWEVVQGMATAFGGGAPAAAAFAGEAGWLRPDARRIEDHLGANAARAAGVDGGHAVFLALWSGDPVVDGGLLVTLRPDQVWLAVDAGRKEADTAAWVGALRRSMEHCGFEPAGLAVVGKDLTTTPDTVQALDLPVGWQDGPAQRTRPGGGRRGAHRAGIE